MIYFLNRPSISSRPGATFEILYIFQQQQVNDFAPLWIVGFNHHAHSITVLTSLFFRGVETPRHPTIVHRIFHRLVVFFIAAQALVGGARNFSTSRTSRSYPTSSQYHSSSSISSLSYRGSDGEVGFMASLASGVENISLSSAILFK